ncbi:MAG: sulfatase-like hydrolase/transferase [Steroidobacteraceae bacterium]
MSTEQTPRSTAEISPVSRKDWWLLPSSFLCFIFLYYLPSVMYGLDTAIDDDRVQSLFKDVLASPHVKLHLLVNGLAHFLLLIGFFSLLWGIAHKAARTWRIEPRLCIALTLIIGWVFLISGNAAVFEQTTYTFAFPFLNNPLLAVTTAAIISSGSLWIILTSRALRRCAVLVGGILALTPLTQFSISTAVGAPGQDQPNVILIGVDSFSHNAYARLANNLPTISQLMTSGTSYERAYTPIGRTFPAWMSILSGKQAADNGGLFNLRNMDFVEKSDLISTELQQRGFHTVFAMDERRFNNIDESFGFDEIVGPEVGALDFALQQINDTPLTNVLLQTKVAKWLLPYSYTNTESPANYDASAFVQNTMDAAKDSKPLFLAIHFESAHFPFETRHAKIKFNTENDFWNKHAAALTVVDRQIEQLLQGLKEQGQLRNALVILLSDHGEALGYPESTLAFPEDPNEIQSYGHGTSVVSDHQNHIVLAVNRFRDGSPVANKNSDSRQVSLLDLRGAITRFLAEGTTTIAPTTDCIYTETDLRFSAAEDYRSLDPAVVAQSSASYYEIDKLGRLRIRETRLPELASIKDFGLRCPDRVTYFSNFAQQFFTLSLDSAGLPKEKLPANQTDINLIKAYKEKIMKQLQG